MLNMNMMNMSTSWHRETALRDGVARSGPPLRGEQKERKALVPNSIRIPVSYEYVFPNGALFLGVDKVVDFTKIREDDNQARDENGTRIWAVKVMDLDPGAGSFGRSTEVKVKIAAHEAPAPPAAVMPGYPPVVAFTDMTVTPYTDNNSCKGDKHPHKCRARLSWSIRAGAMVAPERTKAV